MATEKGSGSRRSSLSKPPLPPSPRRGSQSSAPQQGPPQSNSGSGSRRSSKSTEPASPQTTAPPDASQNASGGLPSAPPLDQAVVPPRRTSQLGSPQPPSPVIAPAPPAQPPSSAINVQASAPQSAAAMVDQSLGVINESKVETEKEPRRAGPFRGRPETKVMRRISLEMRHRMFLMGMRIQYDETGPIGCSFFVMGEIGKTFVVKIREFPCCQCGDFLLQRLCKHMMFVSLRVFRLEQSDHRIWQQALLPKELKELMAHPLITPPPPKAAFRSMLRKPPPPDPPGPPQPETPICCPICFDDIQLFDNEVKKPLGAKRGPTPKPKLEMGTRRKKVDKTKVEEVLAEPWAERFKKFEPLLHCPTQNCQVDGCMKIVHEHCYLKWNRFKKMSYDLPQVSLPNNFYPCAFTCH